MQTVLVVDDEEIVRDVVVRYLRRDGYRTLEAADGDEALRLLEEESLLVMPGNSFNLTAGRHFRITLLPPPAELREVFARIERVLARLAAAQMPPRSALA